MYANDEFTAPGSATATTRYTRDSSCGFCKTAAWQRDLYIKGLLGTHAVVVAAEEEEGDTNTNQNRDC